MSVFRFVLVAVTAAAAAVGQHSLQLTDGRFVTDQQIERHERGAVIKFKHGDVIVPRELIRDCTAFEVDAADASMSEEDKARVEKGQALFEGKWMPVAKRDALLAERVKTRAKRIAEAEAHRLWRNRYTMKTKNFEFEYTIDPEVMERYADMLEVYYSTFTKEWGIRKPSGMGRLKVCFYHDQDYFQQVGGAPPGVIGYFRFVA
ncbi:MAG: hypothetical protein KDC48_16510, partial [Planctomycetes bacterium]|nr:hypothetical protein [Planctomycetota bacterium]